MLGPLIAIHTALVICLEIERKEAFLFFGNIFNSQLLLFLIFDVCACVELRGEFSEKRGWWGFVLEVFPLFIAPAFVEGYMLILNIGTLAIDGSRIHAKYLISLTVHNLVFVL